MMKSITFMLAHNCTLSTNKAISDTAARKTLIIEVPLIITTRGTEMQIIQLSKGKDNPE